MFRPDGDALLPNYRHLPIGYHGRAGSIVVSGTQVARPHGQRPDFGPTNELDVEVELGFVTGPGKPLGTPIATHEVREHVFGFVLVNDWSARDLQRWEYRPLGPFLAQVVRDLDLALDRPAGGARALPGPGARAGPGAARVPAHRGRLGARPRPDARAQRRGHQPHERPRPLLDVPPAARARDGQRRRGPPGRPVRQRHDLRADAGQRRVADRARPAVPGRRRHRHHPRRGRDGLLRRGARDDRQARLRAVSHWRRNTTAISTIVRYSA